MKLKNIASIYSGLSFREKIIHNPEGDVGVVQMRDLISEYTEIDSELDKISDNGIKPKYFLDSGDILIVSKGANNHAILFDSFPIKAIASASFFTVKIKSDIISPEYLHWYLNHPLAQNELKKQQSGTYTPSLKITALQDLEISLLPIEKQRKVGKLHQLHLREKKLQNQLIENKQTLIDNLLISTIRKIK